jgi:hypothetical protein
MKYLEYLKSGCLMLGVFALFGSQARADTLDGLLTEAEILRANSAQDIEFLISNGADCSRYFSRFEPYLVSSGQKLSASLVTAYANIGSGTGDALKEAIAADDTLSTNIDSIEATLGEKVPFPAFGTADQNLIKAFAADPHYPRCVAADPSNVNSTAQGIAYQDFKLKLPLLKAAVAALKKETSARM